MPWRVRATQGPAQPPAPGKQPREPSGSAGAQPLLAARTAPGGACSRRARGAGARPGAQGARAGLRGGRPPPRLPRLPTWDRGRPARPRTHPSPRAPRPGAAQDAQRAARSAGSPRAGAHLGRAAAAGHVTGALRPPRASRRPQAAGRGCGLPPGRCPPGRAEGHPVRLRDPANWGTESRSPYGGLTGPETAGAFWSRVRARARTMAPCPGLARLLGFWPGTGLGSPRRPMQVQTRSGEGSSTHRAEHPEPGGGFSRGEEEFRTLR